MRTFKIRVGAGVLLLLVACAGTPAPTTAPAKAAAATTAAPAKAKRWTSTKLDTIEAVTKELGKLPVALAIRADVVAYGLNVYIIYEDPVVVTGAKAKATRETERWRLTKTDTIDEAVKEKERLPVGLATRAKVVSYGVHVYVIYEDPEIATGIKAK